MRRLAGGPLLGLCNGETTLRQPPVNRRSGCIGGEEVPSGSAGGAVRGDGAGASSSMGMLEMEDHPGFRRLPRSRPGPPSWSEGFTDVVQPPEHPSWGVEREKVCHRPFSTSGRIAPPLAPARALPGRDVMQDQAQDADRWMFLSRGPQLPAPGADPGGRGHIRGPRAVRPRREISGGRSPHPPPGPGWRSTSLLRPGNPIALGRWRPAPQTAAPAVSRIDGSWPAGRFPSGASARFGKTVSLLLPLLVSPAAVVRLSSKLAWLRRKPSMWRSWGGV